MSAVSAVRAAIVDLDGTMVDTLGDFVAALDATLHDMALPAVPPSFVAQAIGKGSEHLVLETLRSVGSGQARFDEAFAGYQRHYELINGRHAEVYPGVREGLARLAARGMKLACLTNKPRGFAMQLLQAKGLEGYFDLSFGGDSFERKKPDPMPLLGTCAALGIAPAQTLMIGDSSNDAAAARAAGCRVVLVTYGYNHGRPIRDVDADGFVERLDEVDAWLASLPPEHR